MLNGLGGHIGAAEGAVAIGDDFDVNGAAVSILWASPSKVLEGSGFLRAPAPSAGLGPAVLLTHHHRLLPRPDLRPHDLRAMCSGGQSAP